MSRYIDVEVTAEDIAEGTPEDSYDCPLARALRHAGHWDACVCNASWRAGENWALLPADAIAFIEDFDAGNTVEACVFRLALP